MYYIMQGVGYIKRICCVICISGGYCINWVFWIIYGVKYIYGYCCGGIVICIINFIIESCFVIEIGIWSVVYLIVCIEYSCIIGICIGCQFYGSQWVGGLVIGQDINGDFGFKIGSYDIIIGGNYSCVIWVVGISWYGNSCIGISCFIVQCIWAVKGLVIEYKSIVIWLGIINLVGLFILVFLCSISVIYIDFIEDVDDVVFEEKFYCIVIVDIYGSIIFICKIWGEVKKFLEGYIVFICEIKVLFFGSVNGWEGVFFFICIIIVGGRIYIVGIQVGNICSGVDFNVFRQAIGQWAVVYCGQNKCRVVSRCVFYGDGVYYVQFCMWVILIGVSFGDSKYILVSLGVGVGIIVVKVFWIVWID